MNILIIHISPIESSNCYISLYSVASSLRICSIIKGKIVEENENDLSGIYASLEFCQFETGSYPAQGPEAFAIFQTLEGNAECVQA